MPGELSPFDDLFLTPSAYDHSNCTTRSAPTAVQPDHNFAATIDPPTTDPSGAQIITGTVTNKNSVSVSNAQLFFTFYANATDNPLRTIAEDPLWVNFGNPLDPSSVTPSYPFTLTRLDVAPVWNGVKASLSVAAPTPPAVLNASQDALPP